MSSFLWFVTGDIHSDGAILNDIIATAQAEGADKLLIAGDLCPKTPAVSLLLHNAPFSYVAVKGNCDWLWDFRDSNLAIPQETAYLACPDGRHVGMTHGHSIWDVSAFPYPLVRGDIFVQGHTHVPLLEKDERGIIHLNPGSPARPRSEYKATYAVISEKAVEVRKLKNNKVIMSLQRSTFS